ncbi:hypothetical protein [Peribacillus muralis]
MRADPNADAKFIQHIEGFIEAELREYCTSTVIIHSTSKVNSDG